MLSDRVEAVNQHVNVFDIDAVVKHLRSVTVLHSLLLLHTHEAHMRASASSSSYATCIV